MFDSQVYQLSEQVYWMKAGKPDRPSLCAVTGSRRTLMLDAGASDAHIRLFLDGLAGYGVRAPDLTVLTHSHWDHIFGAAEIGAPVIAQTLTAAAIQRMGAQEWDNTAIAARVASGHEIQFSADNIDLELPEPRRVRIAPVDILFSDGIDIDLGGVTCQVRHVGGDHAADSSVVFVPEARLLFLSDALYDNIHAPVRYYSRGKALALIETLHTFDAATFIEGHNPESLTRLQFVTLTERMRLASDLAEEFGGDTAAMTRAAEAREGHIPDEDFAYFIQTFAAGVGMNDQP